MKKSVFLRTRWLNIVIALNAFEIIAFIFVGLLSFGSDNMIAVGLLMIAGIMGYQTKELIAINEIAKEGGIILYLILGFAINSPFSILFALQLYGLGFNEPTKELFRNYVATNKFEKLL
ncbi:MAG: hypothetical protein GPJ54_15430 [Candidatus Heimdallarchaeota archaeon]|nr:hypothetical protein [Candidatus Heimdallarchaeota archaeon]